MQKTVVGFMVAGVVLVGGGYALSMSKSDEANMTAENAVVEKDAMEKAAMVEKTEMEDKAQISDAEMKDEMMKDEDGQTVSNDEAMMKKMGLYSAYDTDKLAMAATGDVVLFFKASWCPSCRIVDADIKANLENIPEKLTILEVDYDNSVELKKKYGVTTQHTFVQVDQTGTLIKKWSGGSTLASVVAQVQ